MAEFYDQDIPHRIPILDKESAAPFDLKELDRQWRFISEASRREIIDNPAVRNGLIQYNTRVSR